MKYIFYVSLFIFFIIVACESSSSFNTSFNLKKIYIHNIFRKNDDIIDLYTGKKIHIEPNGDIISLIKYTFVRPLSENKALYYYESLVPFIHQIPITVSIVNDQIWFCTLYPLSDSVKLNQINTKSLEGKQAYRDRILEIVPMDIPTILFASNMFLFTGLDLHRKKNLGMLHSVHNPPNIISLAKDRKTGNNTEELVPIVIIPAPSNKYILSFTYSIMKKNNMITHHQENIISFVEDSIWVGTPKTQTKSDDFYLFYIENNMIYKSMSTVCAMNIPVPFRLISYRDR